MLPPSQSWGTLPSHVDSHAGTGSVQPGDFFSPIRGCRLCYRERIDWDRLFITLFCCAATGGKPEMLVWFSLSQYTRSLTFLLTLGAHKRVGMLLALPLLYWKAAPVTLKPVKTTWKQTQNQAQKETDIKFCWFLLLLNSGRTELGWTTHVISFSMKITCTALFFPSYCIKQGPSDTVRGDLLMPQLQDGVYTNHFISSFLNAQRSPLSDVQKHLFLFRSKHRNWIIPFPTEIYSFHFFTGLRQKEKYKKKHIWNPQIQNFLP